MTKAVYSSDQFPAHLSDQDRVRKWRDFHADHFGEIEILPSGNTPFSAHCALQSFGEIGVMQYQLTVDRFVRRARHIPSDAQDSCAIGMIASDTRSRIGQRNHEIEIGKGTPYLTLIDEPFSCGYDSPYIARGIAVPRKVLRERLPGFSFDHVACLAPSPVWQHLDRYMAVLLETDFQGDSGLERQAEVYIVDLLALGLGARGDSAELATARGLRAVRLREAVAEIGRRYTDPAFSSDDLARALGLSRRYVNELLHESGVSFSERVLELRLLKTRAMLSDPRHDRLRISDIAFACGFNEVSYFNRRFRARFGCSPTQCRGGA